MIDIHTHILPGLDDGPEDWEETIEMCRLAKEDGIDTLVATPHIMDGVYPNRREEIVKRVGELRERIKGKIEMEVYWGADIHIAEDLVERIRRGEVPTINDKGYILLELPHHILPPQMDDLLFKLRLMKITPILTHIERSYWIQKEFQWIYRFVDMGALIQITAMSLTGGFGRAARSLSRELLRLGLAHIIASDCHSQRLRSPGLSSAFKVASAIVGEDAAYAMVKERPLRIIEGKEVAIPIPKNT